MKNVEKAFTLVNSHTELICCTVREDSLRNECYKKFKSFAEKK
uniref:Uncharacterized protein n=1 Tax=Meloidogyne enterolobii TaxID=390850 RepID=A0A6V7UCK2_MELEN|nr:unnamed protein product [Meloidogyne enterolobii]